MTWRIRITQPLYIRYDFLLVSFCSDFQIICLPWTEGKSKQPLVPKCPREIYQGEEVFQLAAVDKDFGLWRLFFPSTLTSWLWAFILILPSYKNKNKPHTYAKKPNPRPEMSSQTHTSFIQKMYELLQTPLETFIEPLPCTVLQYLNTPGVNCATKGFLTHKTNKKSGILK